MSEYVFDFGSFEECDIATGLKEPIVRCEDCAKSRVERHKGDPERVCWKRESHGEVVPDMGFCHDGVARGEDE